MTSTHSPQKFILSGIVSICCTLSVLPTAHATIYKWTDNQGNTHYSDERPGDTQLEIKEIRIKTSVKKTNNTKQKPEETTRKTASGAVNAEKPRTNEKPKDNVDQVKQRLTNINQAKQQRCEQARTELAILNKDIPVYLDETEQYRLNWAGDTYTGKRSYLADEERKTAIDKAKETIAGYCRNPNDEKAQTIARRKWARAEYCLLNQAILKDLQRADIKASARQLNKQQELTDKYCNDTAIALSTDEAELEIFPR